MNERQLLEAMSGMDDTLLARSEKTAHNKLWKKVLPLAACFCLIVAAAWIGISGNLPRPAATQPDATVPQQQLSYDWEVSYNRSESIHSFDRALPLGYFTEKLNERELDAVMPEKSYDWMKVSGVAGFSGEGKLLNVQLQITTQNPDACVDLIIGDDLDCCVVVTDIVLSKCGELEYSVYQYTSDNQDYKLEAIVNFGNVPAKFSMIVPGEQMEEAKADFEAILECFAWYEAGEPDLAAVTADYIPEWYDKQITWDEAAADQRFGALWLSGMPEGFSAESIRRHKDQHNDYLSGLWTCGLNELSWRVRYYTEEDAQRLTSVADKQNYDLSLYPIPRAESVPQELYQIVDNPIFLIEELTLEAVQARAYRVNDAGDSSGWRMQFSVKFGDKLVSISAKGVDPQWVYDQLKAL